MHDRGFPIDRMDDWLFSIPLDAGTCDLAIPIWLNYCVFFYGYSREDHDRPEHECPDPKTAKENRVLRMVPDNDHRSFFNCNFAVHAGTGPA